MEYLLRKENDNKELFSTNIDLSNGCKFKSKNNKTIIKVSNINVMDPKMINDILTIKFNKRFKNLLKLVNAVLNNEDADDADTALALDEVSLVKGILLNKYQKFLDQNKEQLLLKKLRILENELRMKQVIINNKYSYDEMTNGKSR